MIKHLLPHHLSSGIRGNRESGLTLIELLVALVLLAFVSMMLTGGLRFSARAWEYSDSQLEKSERLLSVQRLLRSIISTARPRDRRSARRRRSATGVTEQDAFIGDPQIVKFIAQLPRHHGQGGLYRIAFEEIPGNQNTSNFLIRWRPMEAGFADIKDGETEEWTKTILLENVEKIKFEYFGKLNKAENESWAETWSDSRQLPVLVRLSVEFPKGDRRRWPALTVKLIATAP